MVEQPIGVVPSKIGSAYQVGERRGNLESWVYRSLVHIALCSGDYILNFSVTFHLVLRPLDRASVATDKRTTLLRVS